MKKKLVLKIIRYSKNVIYIVVAVNKKSIRSHYIEKLGVCFKKENKNYRILSLKKLSYWLNKGAYLSNYVSYICTLLFSLVLNWEHYLKKNNSNYNQILLKQFTNISIKKNFLKN